MKKYAVLLFFIVLFSLFLIQQSFGLHSSKFAIKCLGDTNKDGIVDAQDVNTVKSAYRSKLGDNRYNPLADFDGNGVVDINDATVVGRNYGKKLHRDNKPCERSTASISSSSSSISTASTSTILKIDPPIITATRTFSAFLAVDNAENLVGIDINLTYNTTLMPLNFSTFTNTSLATLASNNKILVLSSENQSIPGEAHFAFVILEEINAITGNATLLNIVFNTTAPIDPPLGIHDDVLVNTTVDPIPHITQNGTVIIGGGGGGGGPLVVKR